MQDFIYIIIMTSLLWFVDISNQYKQEVDTKLSMYDENMAVIWVASEETTQKLKQCESKRKRK